MKLTSIKPKIGKNFQPKNRSMFDVHRAAFIERLTGYPNREITIITASLYKR